MEGEGSSAFRSAYESACKACGVEVLEDAIAAVAAWSDPNSDPDAASASAISTSSSTSTSKSSTTSETSTRSLQLRGNTLERFNRRLENSDIQALAAGIKEAGVQVEALDLSWNDLDDSGAQAVVDLVLHGQLRSLNLAHNHFSGQGLQSLFEVLESGKTSLAELVLTANPLEPFGGRRIARLLPLDTCALEVLELGSTEQDMDSLVDLAAAMCRNTSVRVLNVDNPRLFSWDDELATHYGQMLARHPTLEDLSLGKCRLRCSGVQVMVDALLCSSQSRLRALRLRCNKVSIQGSEALASLLMANNVRLALLDLEANPVASGADALGDSLRHTDSLATLNLAHCSIQDDALCSLAKGLAVNASVAELRLWGNNFAQPAAQLFDTLCKGRLRHLDVTLDFMPSRHDESCEFHIARLT